MKACVKCTQLLANTDSSLWGSIVIKARSESESYAASLAYIGMGVVVMKAVFVSNRSGVIGTKEKCGL